MFDTLETLCTLNGISGREHAVRDYLISQIAPLKDVSFYTDAIGNLIAEKTGTDRSKKKVMLAAHMDEVGMMVTYITDEGYIKFANVGGIDTKALLGKAVQIGEIPGVIGVKPIHLMNKESERDIPPQEDLYIDIGVPSRTEAERLVSLGDAVYFDSDYVTFGTDRIKSKAIDDRLGCAVMLEMLREPLAYDAVFVFTVQEEVGCRGAAVAANRIQPDFAIVLESTTAADIDGVSGEKRVCALGGGAVVSFMDRSTVYAKELYTHAMKTAQRLHIPVQTKTMVAGGNDAGAIHKAGVGVKTIAVSVPCRYLHSPSCVIDKNDAVSTAKLAEALFEEYANDCFGQ